ncbi:methylenetetrahydrofolate reductase [Paenibacillus soyae]|uniref:Methylenetetrahydrofolate reductase n=1 Tax=Paenibacillus soyae TaxID=2969249 RepID=A0A9X2SCL9_9BACL|nr:methylenetetrahydrofolate reductase [Paenibacillus soyae]MCR2806918.1 methylenetetrahydrofolate reductase [Paenibacillus soyae]
MLRDKIVGREPGILTYGITPPKMTNTPEKIAEIAQKQVERIKHLDIDALILYDVQDEADRTDQERPFPYLQTLDPAAYSEQYLHELQVPSIIYRCVGRYSKEQFVNWVTADQERDLYSVYVGASSSKQEVTLNVAEASRLSCELNRNLNLGGVVIPERHMKRNDEHLRVQQKIENGCRFFVSQAVYNVEASKNFLSDYYYHCANNGLDMVPILFNLAPCGSEKTLEFMKWLGISIPKWLENELKYSHDVLDKSIQLSKTIFEEILDFALDKGIPVGCSVESVSTRKVEIEASVQLVRDIKTMLDKKLKKPALNL